MKRFNVIVRGDRNRMWSRYPTQEQALEAVTNLKGRGFDAWVVPPIDADTSPRERPKPLQLELQFD